MNNLQIDMFTGELVDNRTRWQRIMDNRRAQQEQQPFLFPQREMAVPASLTPLPLKEGHRWSMALYIEDPRTPEEIEEERQREIAKRHIGELFQQEEAMSKQKRELATIKEPQRTAYKQCLPALRELRDRGTLPALAGATDDELLWALAHRMRTILDKHIYAMDHDEFAQYGYPVALAIEKEESELDAADAGPRVTTVLAERKSLHIVANRLRDATSMGLIEIAVLLRIIEMFGLPLSVEEEQ